ncbi:iron ABC transporter permease [Paenibacillus sp. N1-5-1-14]|uniref:FecCD family ABC transporter permease n=1 Tax=Paenibacillus radicibacter TaxID=2972488 RepID=UPI002158CAA7|nr:iron ABC transporter permease [Paenibacillus radicibacter]MCR8645609.1 iron ABC transporter permease [Paenibacillus radicibacter]
MFVMLQTSYSKAVGLIGLVITVMLLIYCSLAMGQTSISFRAPWNVLTNYNPDNTEHLVIATSRLTRALSALVVGMTLAVAGVLVQALTRNPLAAPDLIGVNAGAIFFIIVAITWLDIQSLSSYMWFAFAGAAVAGVAVFLLSSVGRDGLTPIKIILAGTALSALFISFTQGLLVIDEQTIQTVLFWIAGSIAGRDMSMLLPVLPILLIALLLSLLLGKSMNVFSSGDDVAKSLGQNVGRLKLLMGLLIILLAGGSVAIVGSIGFIGLIVPHIAKRIVGIDYRWSIPYGALLGSCLLLAADISARFIIIPQEVPIGVMTALIGGPFFIYLAKKGVFKQ